MLKSIKLYLKILELFWPKKAIETCYNLFFTPIRTKNTKEENNLLTQFDSFVINSNEQALHVYERGEGPVILFCHGWSGRASQGFTILNTLADLGFKVVAIDFEGHGMSSGRQTDIIRMVDALKVLETKYGSFNTMIGHSFGGIVSLYAFRQGIQTEKLVTISTPHSADYMLEHFKNLLNVKPTTIEAMVSLIETNKGVSFSELDSKKLLAYDSNLPLLIIHDKDDQEAPFELGKAFSEFIVNSKFCPVSGTSHNKILWNKRTIEAIGDFVKN